MLKPTALILAILIMLLSACAREEPPTPTDVPPTQTAPAAQEVPTEAPSPTATVPPTATPEPTPIPAAISVEDQPLAEDGRLTFAVVALADDGWLVLYANRDGQVAEILGYTPVEAGIHENVVVQIDPLQSSAVMVARLHVDAGDIGTFEFPGPDMPLSSETNLLSVQFEVESQFTVPSITVADQELTADGVVRVDRVYSTGPGWLLIQADVDGQPGRILGFAMVKEGSNEDLLIPIQWRQSSARLFARLHADNGRSERWDEELDPVIAVAGEPVMVSFAVILPPDIYIIDQPVVDEQIVVDRVTSSGPSWLVIYSDNEGVFDRIIGFAPLEDGVNERLVVPLVGSLVTEKLHVLQHEDSVPGGDFDFPRSDGPLTYDGRLPATYTFQTNPGNYLITLDQTLDLAADSPAVIVPLVVVDLPSWLVIFASQDGQAGEPIGYLSLPAGVNRDVQVPVDAELVTPVLYAGIHINAGDLDQFEFPDGVDVPFRYSGELIQSPFTLLAPEE